MSILQKIDMRWFIVLILVMLVIFGLLLSSSSSDDSSTGGDNNTTSSSEATDSKVSPGATYQYSSSDNSVTGVIKVAETFDDGLTSFDFAFVIKDSVSNNGICQSNDQEYCAKETSQNIEKIKYRYGVTFAETEATDRLVATVYEPIYCNLEAAQADPLNIGYNKTDISCDGWMVPNWEPTTWFIAKNRSSTLDFEALLSGITLNIYDISKEFAVEVGEDGSITTGRLDYDQIIDNQKVNSFSLSPVDNQ